MSFFEAIILGIIQGLTEFLPISSTAHLRILPAIFGWADPGARFTAVIQLGTMAAVVVFFWHDLVRVATTWTRSLTRRELRGELNARMGWYLIIGTIPIVIFGFLLRHQIENGARSLYLMGVSLIAFGLILGAADWWGSKKRPVASVGRRDAIVVGLAQALALIPGVSRSGATITAGLFLGLTREAAARFSFLLAIPAIVLSGLYELVKMLGEPADRAIGLGPIFISTVVAFAVGYASIAFLLRWLVRHTVCIFVVYRVAVGLIILILAGSGAIT